MEFISYFSYNTEWCLVKKSEKPNFNHYFSAQEHKKIQAEESAKEVY